MRALKFPQASGKVKRGVTTVSYDPVEESGRNPEDPYGNA